MAILNNLIVHGSSKFLNDAYFNILAADTGRFNKLATKVLGNDGETITVHGLMDVQGELHTKSWSNSNIATIDGSFFICPTLKVTETGSTSNGLTITQSGNTWSIQITSSSAVVTNSVYTMNSSGTVTTTGIWTLGSKVAITGEILVNNEWLPLGTLRGIITARSSDLKSVTVSNITDGYSFSNNILNIIGTQSNVKHRNIKISLYEWTLSDSGTPTSAITNPIGIYMTALGDGTGQTMIDIYGGQEPSGTTYKGLAKPYVRIGNLSGLSSLSVGGQNPKGWGIYTSNGYFEGTIAARRGYIGNNTKYWTIGTSGTNSTIFSGPTTVSATGTAGTYLGTDGFLNTASSSVYAQITNGILTAKGADITGVINADTGRIGGTSGWTIASQQIYSTGKTIGANDSMFLSTKNLAGTVAGQTLTTTAPSWRLTVGSNFGVDNTGKLYASGAEISGTIDATSFSAKYYDNSNVLQRQIAFDAFGLKIMDGASPTPNILSQFGTTSTIGRNSGDNYNIDITGTAIDLRYNTNVLNRIDSSGMTLYDGQGIADSNIIAEFGTSGATIGQEDTAHIILSSTAFKLRYGNENYDYVEFYDSRDSSTGLTTYEEIIEYVPPSPYNPYITQKVYTQHDIDNVNNINWVKVDDVDISLSTISFSWPNGVGIRELGQSNATVEINYSSPEVFKAFTLGRRKDSYDIGAFSCVIGNSNAATNDNTFSIGNNSIASGNGSMAQGQDSKAFGADSCASGYQAEAHGFVSHSEGYRTHAIGSYSHAQNHGTVANVAAQTVIGSYNKATRTGSGTDADPYMYSGSGDYAFIIGNGSNDDTESRSNALTVDWDGRLRINNVPTGLSQAYIQMRHINLDSDGTAPGTTTYGGNLYANDVDNTRIGYFECFHATNGNIGINIGSSRMVNGSMVYNSIGTQVTPSGARAYSVADAVAFRKAINIYSTYTFYTASAMNQTISATSNKTVTITIPAATMSGKTILAIRGWNFNNSSSGGQNCSVCVPYSCIATGNTVTLEIRNNASSQAKIDIYVYCILVENNS